ncbi:MAG: sigma-70 family RNA polymerase sigma factor [Hyphomicrobiaceae bacterium]
MSETSAARRTEVSADDAALMRRIGDRDQAALAALFGRHQTRVFRFVLRLVRSEAMAEELTNEVFMEVWRYAHRFEGRSTLSSWILGIAHNKAISALRKRREEGLDEGVAEQIADDADSPEVDLQKQDKGALLRACIARLGTDHREIIDLVYYQEMSVAEAASVLSIPENTVKTRMFYARKKLSELLKAAGVDRGWP